MVLYSDYVHGECINAEIIENIIVFRDNPVFNHSGEGVGCEKYLLSYQFVSKQFSVTYSVKIIIFCKTTNIKCLLIES